MPGKADWVDWSPVGERLAYGEVEGNGSSSYTWHPTGPEPSILPEMDRLRGPGTFLASGKHLLAVSEDYTVTTHDARTGRREASLDTGARILIKQVGGERLLVWNHDKSTEVWDLPTGRRLVEAKPQTGRVPP